MVGVCRRGQLLDLAAVQAETPSRPAWIAGQRWVLGLRRQPSIARAGASRTEMGLTRLVIVSAASIEGLFSSAQAASVDCPPTAVHPVCKANYAMYPRGAHPPEATGMATVNGKQVQWRCRTGSDNPPKPRRCSY